MKGEAEAPQDLGDKGIYKTTQKLLRNPPEEEKYLPNRIRLS
jgi:hypothetical protein